MLKDRLLITGGSGFLGGHLVIQAKKNFDVFASFHNHPNDHPGVNWIKWDLFDTEAIKEKIFSIKPKYIIHTAAMAKADECEKRKSDAKKINIEASEEIAKAGKMFGSRIIFLSTDLIFRGNKAPYDEDDIPGPLSFYGWTKWEAEKRILKNCPDHVIIRPGIMFGPPAVQGTSFSEWMRMNWEKESTTPLFIDQYRTPIYAGTLSAAILELTRINYTGYLNLAGLQRLSRFEFGKMLAEQLNVDTNLIKPVKMADVPSITERPLDVSLKMDRALSILKMRFPGVREDIEIAYKSNA